MHDSLTHTWNSSRTRLRNARCAPNSPLTLRAVEVTPWTDNASEYSCRYKNYFSELAKSCGVKHVRVPAEGATTRCDAGYGDLGVNVDHLAKLVVAHLPLKS